jgi:tubulin-specific chaperone E
VVLDSMLIRVADSAEDIRRVCPKITSLDLSRNLFSSLSEVAAICAPLEHLRTLRLTGNRFWHVTPPDELRDAFSGIEWVALNMCVLNWSEVDSFRGLTDKGGTNIMYVSFRETC